jgi:hypothetical protein
MLPCAPAGRAPAFLSGLRTAKIEFLPSPW